MKNISVYEVAEEKKKDEEKRKASPVIPGGVGTRCTGGGHVEILDNWKRNVPRNL